MDLDTSKYIIGCDPCASGAAGSTSVFKLITIDEVVRGYLKHRPIIDYQAEAARIAHYYGAQLLTEEGEFAVTEDAEVVSIETVPWRP